MLLATYGTLSAEAQVWVQTSEHMGYTEPVSRIPIPSQLC